MKIINTNIKDIDIKNIDQEKVNLANKIIGKVSPLFNELHSDKENQISLLEKTIENKKKSLNNQKKELENLVNEYNRKKKIKKLVSRLSVLINSGFIHDGHLKSQHIVLLKIIDRLPNEKLDQHLYETIKIINSRLSS